VIGADFGGAYPQQADLIAWINYIKSQYGATITYDVAADPYFTIGSMYNKNGYIPFTASGPGSGDQLQSQCPESVPREDRDSPGLE
jgi:hypothetical protein